MSECTCHLGYPPCGHCVSTCGECLQQVDSEGFCQTCSDNKAEFILDVIKALQRSKVNSKTNGASYVTSNLYRETEKAINMLEESLGK